MHNELPFGEEAPVKGIVERLAEYLGFCIPEREEPANDVEKLPGDRWIDELENGGLRIHGLTVRDRDGPAFGRGRRW